MTRINKGDTFPVFEFSTAYEDGLNSKEVLKGKTIFWVLRYIGCICTRKFTMRRTNILLLAAQRPQATELRERCTGLCRHAE